MAVLTQERLQFMMNELRCGNVCNYPTVLAASHEELRRLLRLALPVVATHKYWQSDIDLAAAIRDAVGEDSPV